MATPMRAREQHRRRKVLTARRARCREAGRGTISGASVPTKTWLSESRRGLQSEVPFRAPIPRATRGDARRSAAARWFHEEQFRAPSYVRDFRGVGDQAHPPGQVPCHGRSGSGAKPSRSRRRCADARSMENGGRGALAAPSRGRARRRRPPRQGARCTPKHGRCASFCLFTSAR